MNQKNHHSTPEKSLLSKFRTQHLGETTLNDIIIEIVRQCLKKGLLDDESVSIDATHVEANTIKKTPERLMKHLAQNIIKSYQKDRNSNFFGYKVEFIMTTGKRLITAVQVGSGVYVDGTEIERLLEDTQASGLKLKELYGDRAYFRKPILEKIEAIEAEAYIPVSGSAYHIDESEFSNNKDSDQWFCSQGNETVKRAYYKRKRKDLKGGYSEGYKYYFDLKTCKT